MNIKAQSRRVLIFGFAERYLKTDLSKLTQGGFWLAIGQAISVISQLSLAIAFGYMLVPDKYGIYRVMLEVLAIANALAPLGIANEVSRDAALGKLGSLIRGVSLNIRWSFLLPITALIVACGGFVYGVEWFIVAGAILLLPLQNSFTLYSAYLQGKKEFSKVAVLTSGVTFFQSAVTLVFLYFVREPLLLFCVYVCSGLLANAAAFWYIKRNVFVNNEINEPGFVAGSKYQTGLSTINTIAGHADALLIAWLLGPFALATYVYATGAPDQIRSLFKTMSTMLFPWFVQRDNIAVRAGLKHKMLVVGVCAFLMGVVYALFAPLIFNTLFPLYTAAIPYSQWYAIGITVTVIVFIPLSAINARGDHHAQVKHVVISSIVQMLCYVVLIPLFSIDGALFSLVIGRLFAAWYAYHLARREPNTLTPAK